MYTTWITGGVAPVRAWLQAGVAQAATRLAAQNILRQAAGIMRFSVGRAGSKYRHARNTRT
jgi:hypothetical protein